jgi:hypothetical protein
VERTARAQVVVIQYLRAQQLYFNSNCHAFPQSITGGAIFHVDFLFLHLRTRLVSGSFTVGYVLHHDIIQNRYSNLTLLFRLFLVVRAATNVFGTVARHNMGKCRILMHWTQRIYELYIRQYWSKHS